MSPVRTTSPSDRTAELIRQVNRPHAFLNVPTDVPGEGPLAHAQGLNHFVHRVDDLADIDREKFRHAFEEVAGKSRLSELLVFPTPPASPVKSSIAAVPRLDRAGMRLPQGSSPTSSPTFSDDCDAQTVVGNDLAVHTKAHSLDSYGSGAFAQLSHPPPIAQSGDSVDSTYGMDWPNRGLDPLCVQTTHEVIPSSYTLGNGMTFSPESETSDSQFVLHSSYDAGYQGTYDPSIAVHQSGVQFPTQQSVMAAYQDVTQSYTIPSPTSAPTGHPHSRLTPQAGNKRHVSDSDAETEVATSATSASMTEAQYAIQYKSQVMQSQRHSHPHIHQLALGRNPSPSPRKKIRHDPRAHHSMQLYPHHNSTSSPSPTSSGTTSPTGVPAPVPTHLHTSVFSPSDAPQGYSPPRNPAHLNSNNDMMLAVQSSAWQGEQIDPTDFSASVDISPQSLQQQQQQQQWWMPNSATQITPTGDNGLTTYQLPPSAAVGTNPQTDFSSFANHAMGSNVAHPSHYGLDSNGGIAMRDAYSTTRRSSASPSMGSNAGNVPQFFQRQSFQGVMLPGVAYPGQQAPLPMQGNTQQFQQHRSDSYTA